MDTKAVIARFEAERQVLALLDHPNVAKVFDAGTTPQGRPYFVMELVRGIRITDYCEHSRLSIPERLTLFIQVCQAIRHAHQCGIIHRDIKPSNVMVTMHDGLPLAKVIDFGIAKAIQGRLTIDQTFHTGIDRIVGTPAYISPEQTEPAQRKVDTRSDVYSLGALLYEILTARTPFDSDELERSSLDRLREKLRTEEPPRPSKSLTSLGEDQLAHRSRSCGTTPGRLVKQIRDDLDWIVMQCLEKEPARRYQTVNELIADLERYLRNELVCARPPTFAYAVQKLARRNRFAFVAASAFVLFLAAFAAAMTIQAQRLAAERDRVDLERARAEKVSNVAMDVLAVADPSQSVTDPTSAAAFLDQATKSIDRELRDQPHARASLLHALGRSYVRRGRSDAGLAYLQEALAILRQTPGAEAETLAAMVDLGTALWRTGELHASRKTLAEADTFAQQSGRQRSAEYANLLLSRGRLELRASRVSAAQADFEKSLQLYQAVAGTRSIDIADAMNGLSQIFLWTDDPLRAERMARQAIDLYAASVLSTHPDRLSTEVTLADALYVQGRLDESAALFKEVLPKTAEIFGADNGKVIDILDRLAMVELAQGNAAEAERYAREALAKSRIDRGDKRASTADVSVTLARALMARGDYVQAEAILRRAITVYSATLPADHQYTASTEYFLGEALLARNKLREAEAVLMDSMNRWRRTEAPPWRAMRSASALGEALYRQGRTAEGTTYLSESLRELAADPKADREAKERAQARVKRYLKTSLAAAQ